ncbi:MAG: hypothetical protein ABSA46_05620 [Thermodesulfovibrionales bacterium]|jgi:hypothetical protein
MLQVKRSKLGWVRKISGGVQVVFRYYSPWKFSHLLKALLETGSYEGRLRPDYLYFLSIFAFSEGKQRTVNVS